MRAAKPAVLPQFETSGMGSLILGRSVVPTFALLASQRDYVYMPFSFSHPNTPPKQGKLLEKSNTVSNSMSTIKNGAHNRNRTGDLILTKDALFLLSYVSTIGQLGCGGRI